MFSSQSLVVHDGHDPDDARIRGHVVKILHGAYRRISLAWARVSGAYEHGFAYSLRSALIVASIPYSQIAYERARSAVERAILSRGGVHAPSWLRINFNVWNADPLRTQADVLAVLGEALAEFEMP